MLRLGYTFSNKEIILAYSEIYTKYLNALWAQNVVHLKLTLELLRLGMAGWKIYDVLLTDECVCVCVCVFVCACVCMNECMNVCMYVCMYICKNIELCIEAILHAKAASHTLILILLLWLHKANKELVISRLLLLNVLSHHRKERFSWISCSSVCLPLNTNI
jgi:hypothetical protein